MTDMLGFAAMILAGPLGFGLLIWLISLGNAAEMSAKARLLEAQTASHSRQGEKP
jgi:hypothetical protein